MLPDGVGVLLDEVGGVTGVVVPLDGGVTGVVPPLDGGATGVPGGCGGCPGELGESAWAGVMDTACTTGTAQTAAADTIAPRLSSWRRLSPVVGRAASSGRISFPRNY